MSWRLKPLLGETWRNLTANPARTLATIGLYTVMFGALAAAELTYTTSLLDYAHDYQAAGGNIMIATTPQGLPAATCDALNRKPYVLAAGGLTPTGSGTLATAPGTQFSTGTITSDILTVWDPTSTQTAHLTAGYIIGEDLTTELALRPAALIQPTSQPVAPIHSIAYTASRNPLVTRWLLTSTPPSGPVTECWVEFSPGAYRAAQSLLEVTFADAGSDLTVKPLIGTNQYSRNPAAELDSRPTRHAWAAVAALTTVIIGLTIWFRRSDIGLYRATGTDRLTVLALTQTETLITISLGATLGLLWATTITQINSTTTITVEQFAIALKAIVSGAAAAVALGPLQSLLIRGNLLTLLKDR